MAEETIEDYLRARIVRELDDRLPVGRAPWVIDFVDRYGLRILVMAEELPGNRHLTITMPDFHNMDHERPIADHFAALVGHTIANGQFKSPGRLETVEDEEAYYAPSPWTSRMRAEQPGEH